MDARHRWALGIVTSMAAAAILAVACGTSEQPGSFGGLDAGPTPFYNDTSFPLLDVSTQGPDVIPSGTLIVRPQDQTIDVGPTGPVATVQFHAYTSADAGTPIAATWSVDAPAVGAIDTTGLFTPTGNVGGTLNVYAQAGQAVGQTTLTVRVHIQDLPPGVDGGVLGTLENGGTADTHFQWLYPYDLTVFPRGLLPPRIQWSGGQTRWLLVTAKAKNLDYVGVYAPTNSDNIPGNPTQLDLPQKAWDAITLSAGAKDPVKVQIAKMDPLGGVTGPSTETWTIAQGTLKGIVYYNSYDSPLAEGDGGLQNDMGAVMRIKPGAAQPEVFIGGQAKGSCTVCHTLSANGSTMALSAGHTYDAVFSISADASAPIGPITQKPDNVYSFGALTPDGKYLLSCGSTGLDAGTSDGGPIGLADYGPNVTSMTNELDSRLFDTADGGVVGSIPNVRKALMPSFSPDGTKIAFNRFVDGQDQRLAVASFDESTLTFGPYTDVFVDTGYYLSWPTYLPDSQNFVFMVSGDTDDQYSTYLPPDTSHDANGELLFYTTANHDVYHLRAAMGTRETFPDGGQLLETYLRNPDGTIAEKDRFKNYQPTALPVAAAGYYWVVFTSRRTYGNTIDNSIPNAPQPRSPKKLWVTAMDINGAPGTDWSHPAFYLPGQELASGNLRGFWTLEPCKGNGSSCQSGTECCNGFCREVPGDGGEAFACVPPPVGCSNTDERCKTTPDCCNSPPGVLCIDGFCAIPTPK